MKKVIFGLLLLFAVTTKLSAQTTGEAQIKYWYYPSQNVYYNDATGDYWFYDKTTATWTSAKVLASPYVPVVATDTRYQIMYTGPEVWKANANHKVKYKVKKNGTVKTKVKPIDK